LHQRNPEIIELAELMNRTPGAVAMKACNFASLDPQLQARHIKALGNVSRADRNLWEAFMHDSAGVAQKAEAAYSAMIGNETEDYLPELGHAARVSAETHFVRTPAQNDVPEMPDGPTERDALLKTRRVQSFFRAAVLVSYDNRCALTDLAIPELLNASHIIPWSLDKKRRADPRNGICLNAFHDRAFDRGLISFDENYCVLVSSKIERADQCEMRREQLVKISGKPLRLPERFQPEKDALDYHRKHIFQP